MRNKQQYIKAVFLLLISFLLGACEVSSNNFYKLAAVPEDDILKIIIIFNLREINSVVIVNEEGKEKILDWLKKSHEIKNIGSYASAENSLTIMLNSDVELKFKISDPGLGYTVISSNGNVKLTDEYPDIVELYEIKQFFSDMEKNTLPR